MAIQNRRGAYVDLNPAKAVPGELLVVQSGDPNTTDGKAVYMTFASGDIKLLAMRSDVETAVADVAEDLLAELDNTISTFTETTAPGAVADVADEGAAQITAIGNKGDEVLGSIPSDYSTLSGDVSELKSALDAGDFMVKTGHFTNAEKLLNWASGVRKIQYNTDNNELLMSYVESESGTKTVSCNFTQASIPSASVEFYTTEYPFIVLRTSSNLPNAANSVFRCYFYRANGTSGNQFDVSIPIGENIIVVDIKDYIRNKNLAPDVFTRIEPAGIVTASYSYANAPKCEVRFMGMFTEAEAKAYNFNTIVENLSTDVSKVEIEIDDIKISGGANLFDETKTVFGSLSADGSIDMANLTKQQLASDFIPVVSGEKYTLQIWEPTTGDFWARIIYYASDKSLENYDTFLTGYVLVGGYNYYKSVITIPESITFVRIGFCSFGNGKVCFEKGTVAEDWTNGIGAILNHKSFNTADEYTLKSIQHKGSHQVAPENTMPAFIQSKNEGWHFVETDVSFTQDRVPVLLHDDTLNRTCCNASDGSAISTDLNISTLTYSQLSSYDACTPSKWDTYKGTKIPSFDDFICLCRNIDLHPYIELKTAQSPTADEIRSLVNIVKKWGMADNVTWISFSYTLLNAVHIADPYARLGLLESSYDARVQVNGSMLKSVNNEVFIDASTSVVSSTLINECITYGLPLEVYCPDTEQEILALDGYVSGATSNVVKFSDVISGSILGY